MPGLLEDIWSVQEELLEAAAAALDLIPDVDATLLGAPTRQVIAPPGEFVLDCEQLLVNLGGIGEAPTRPATPLPKRHVTGRIPRPTVNIVIARQCIPIGDTKGTTYTPPSAAQVTASSRQLSFDGWALFNGIFSRLVSGELLDRCTSVEWVSMTPLGPLGAMGAWQLQLRPQLAGYLEEPGS